MDGARIAVYGALTANLGIAVLKFVGAASTGSSAMLSEAIHSAVDSGNEILLLIGIHRASKAPDERHPFGHGKEIYFWSLIVAVLIFGVGGGVSIYEGIQRLAQPRPLESVGWNYAILCTAFVFEGSSLTIALHQFRKQTAGTPFWPALRSSKDPAVYTVIAEDSAALLGLGAAAVGLYGSHSLGLAWVDPAASIVIGSLLCGVSSLLIFQSRKLLVGQAVDKTMAEELRGIAQAEQLVHRAGWPMTMQLGPSDVLLAVDVEFINGTPAQEVSNTVNRIEQTIRERFPEVGRIYIESRQVRLIDALPIASE